MSKTSTKKEFEQQFNEMNVNNDDINEFPFEPGKNIIDNILNYSKALSIRTGKNGDQFEMVLN